MFFVQRLRQFIILLPNVALDFRGDVKSPQFLCCELVKKVVDLLPVGLKVSLKLRLYQVAVIFLWLFGRIIRALHLLVSRI